MPDRGLPLRLIDAYSTSLDQLRGVTASSSSEEVAAFVDWCDWDPKRMEPLYSQQLFPHLLRAIAWEWHRNEGLAIKWFTQALLFNDNWAQEFTVHQIKGLSRQLTTSALHRLYSAAIDDVRTAAWRYFARLSRPRAFASWSVLLLFAASTARGANDYPRALIYHSEVDELVDRVRDPNIAARIAHRNAVAFATLACDAPLFESQWRGAQKLLWDARSIQVRKEKNNVRDFLSLSAAEVRLLRKAFEFGFLGRLTAESRCYELLVEALEVLAVHYLPDVPRSLDLWLDQLPDVVPVSMLSEVTELLSQFSRAAATVGDSQLSVRASLAAARRAADPLRALIAMSMECNWTHDSQHMAFLCEEMLRRADKSLRIRSTERATRQRLKEAATRVGRSFHRMSGRLRDLQPVASNFWLLQGNRMLDLALETVPASQNRFTPRRPVQKTWSDESIRRETENLRQSVHREDPVAVAHSLVRLAGIPATRLTTLNVQFLSDVLEVLEGFHPPRRSHDLDWVSFDGGVPETLLAKILQAAYGFAANYAPYLAVDTLANLSRCPGIHPGHRATVADHAASLARDRGDWTIEIDALIGLATAGDISDQARTGLVRRVCELADAQSGYVAKGLSSLEVSRHVSGCLKDLCEALVLRGCHELAFLVGGRVAGRFLNAFLTDPEIIHEYELLEQYDSNSGLDSELFDAMKDRIISGSQRNPSLPDRPSRTQVRVPHNGAIVQLLSTRNSVVVLVAHDKNGERRFCTFPLNAKDVKLLSRRVWWQMEGTQTANPGSADLKTIYKEIIAPILNQTGEIGELVFVTGPELSSLPLHAARDTDGTYLIERMRVSYSPSVYHVVPPEILRPDRVLLAGWDKSVEAHTEANMIQPILEDSGLEVFRTDSAVSGKKLMLDPEVRVGILHLSGHCTYKAWPLSLHSTIRLDGNVTVSVAEWLRQGCSATFVFVDACHSALSAPDGQDRTGFPLAFGARGATAAVVAMDDVLVESAHIFAKDFYDAFRTLDSIDALRSASLRAISAGRGEASWAPYVHDGPALILARASREHDVD